MGEALAGLERRVLSGPSSARRRGIRSRQRASQSSERPRRRPDEQEGHTASPLCPASRRRRPPSGQRAGARGRPLSARLLAPRSYRNLSALRTAVALARYCAQLKRGDPLRPQRRFVCRGLSVRSERNHVPGSRTTPGPREGARRSRRVKGLSCGGGDNGSEWVCGTPRAVLDSRCEAPAGRGSSERCDEPASSDIAIAFGPTSVGTMNAMKFQHEERPYTSVVIREKQEAQTRTRATESVAPPCPFRRDFAARVQAALTKAPPVKDRPRIGRSSRLTVRY